MFGDMIYTFLYLAQVYITIQYQSHTINFNVALNINQESIINKFRMSRHMSNSQVLSNEKQNKYPPNGGNKWKEIKMKINADKTNSKTTEGFRKFEPNRQHSVSQDKSDKQIFKGIYANKNKNKNTNSFTSLNPMKNHQNLVKMNEKDQKQSGGKQKNLLAESNVFIGSNHNNISNASINRIHYSQIHQVQKEFLKFKQQIFIQLQKQKQLLNKMASDIIRFVNAQIQNILKIKEQQITIYKSQQNTHPTPQTLSKQVQAKDQKILKLKSNLYSLKINDLTRAEPLLPKINKTQPKEEINQTSPLNSTDGLPFSSSYDISAFQKIIHNISKQINQVGGIIDNCKDLYLPIPKRGLSCHE